MRYVLIWKSMYTASLVPGRATILLCILLHLLAQVALSTLPVSVRRNSLVEEAQARANGELMKFEDAIPRKKQPSMDIHQTKFRRTSIPTVNQFNAQGAPLCVYCSPSIQGVGSGQIGSSALRRVHMPSFHDSPESSWMRSFKASSHTRVPPSGPNPSGNDGMSEKSP
ncbi:hypothetical protein KP509_32G008000 [Ceratopteris richardii]|uniref:Uncharacterized protein n=1 Tax=Ceratopteris richardii TaxID=49495 RepID=A0A8T2QRG5_CERRI|nr:hypothetical protein KP509_32G008000 [Ceratopteris richardii]